MSESEDIRTISRGVRAADIAAFITKEGWSEVHTDHARLREFRSPKDDEGNQLVMALPSHDDYEDSRLRVSEAIDQLASYSNVSRNSVIGTLMSFAAADSVAKSKQVEASRESYEESTDASRETHGDMMVSKLLRGFLLPDDVKAKKTGSQYHFEINGKHRTGKGDSGRLFYSIVNYQPGTSELASFLSQMWQRRAALADLEAIQHALHSNGVALSEISNVFHVSPSTVTKWFRDCTISFRSYHTLKLVYASEIMTVPELTPFQKAIRGYLSTITFFTHTLSEFLERGDRSAILEEELIGLQFLMSSGLVGAFSDPSSTTAKRALIQLNAHIAKYCPGFEVNWSMEVAEKAIDRWCPSVVLMSLLVQNFGSASVSLGTTIEG